MTTAEQTVTYDELVAALDKAVDVAIWMSGADDFGPSGKAAGGWINVMRPKLWEALDVLGKAKASNQDSEPK